MSKKLVALPQQSLVDALKTVAIVLVAPTLIFAVVGAFLFLQRPLFNIDYFLLFMVLFPFSHRWAVVALSALLCMDIVFALAPAYHFSMASVLQSTADMFNLNPVYLLTEAGKVLGLLLLFGFVTGRIARSIRNIRPVLITCALLTVGAVGLDQTLPLGTLRAESMPLSNPNIAASTLNDLRIAVQTAAQRGENDGHATPAPSAAKDVGLRTLKMADTHVALIVVESLGQPVSEAIQRFQWAEIDALNSLPKVRVQRGTVPFKGSTVPGELRELCDVRLLVIHPAPETVAEFDCLPKHFALMGFSSTGIHGFSGTLFSRNLWYPQLAFDEVLFAPELREQAGLTKRCGLAFSGACDQEVWGYIAKNILTRTDTKQFVYWLTLTTHLPIEPAMPEDRRRCLDVKELADSLGACDLINHLDPLFASLARSIREGSIRGTRILLVGDHAPPFLDSKTRALFDGNNVPYAFIEID